MHSVHAPLVYADGALYAAYQETEHVWEPPGQPSLREHTGVLALDAADGDLRWLQPLGADSAATRAGALAVAAGTLYAGSDDGYVNALRASDGTSLWRTRLGDLSFGLSFGAPVATDSAIYIGASDGAVYALRPADGALLWRAFVSRAITVASSMSITAMRVSQPPAQPPAPDAPGSPSDPSDLPDPPDDRLMTA